MTVVLGFLTGAALGAALAVLGMCLWYLRIPEEEHLRRERLRERSREEQKY